MIQLEAIETAYGTIKLLKSRATGALAYELGGRSQSAADENGVSLASYIHAIFGLLSEAKARSILLIGGGGGALATMLARARRKVGIVDVNPVSFALARQYFGLPEQVDCHVADGSAFLRADADRYDAIVVDAFHGDHIPSHLRSPAFFEQVREHLTPRGAVFANVHVKHDFDDYADRIAAAMKTAWSDVRVLDALGVSSATPSSWRGGWRGCARRACWSGRKPTQAQSTANWRGCNSAAWKSSRWDFGH